FVTMKRLGFGLSLLLLGFISNALHALGDTLRHTEIVTDCALLVSDTADFNGSIVFTSISNGTRNLFLMDTEQTLELGTGYYNQRNFYSAIDQSLLIWIRAATNQEGPISEAPDTLELWSLETNELLAHYSVPSNYFPLQRLDSGQLIVFDWHERVFLTVTVQQDHLLE